MTLYEFLLKTGIDVKNNNSHLGNHLDSELASKNIKINYEKDIELVTEPELLEIGRIMILAENKDVPFWSNELVDWMKNLVAKHTKK